MKERWDWQENRLHTIYRAGLKQSAVSWLIDQVQPKGSKEEHPTAVTGCPLLFLVLKVLDTALDTFFESMRPDVSMFTVSRVAVFVRKRPGR